jgi:hypothetical protein
MASTALAFGVAFKCTVAMRRQAGSSCVLTGMSALEQA